MSSTTAFAFIVTLKAKLEARPGLADVGVHLILPPSLGAGEAVALVRDRILGEQAYAAMGRLRRADVNEVHGLVRAYRTAGAAGASDSDAVFLAAGERAAAILDEVILQLRDDPPLVGDQTIAARVSEVQYVPVIPDQGGWVVDCEFTIAYEARVS
jgi:hypothetical protein